VKTYACTACGTEKPESQFSYDRDSETGTGKCTECNVREWGKENLVGKTFVTILDSDTAGYAGYNEGLGVDVKDRGHFKKLVKDRNLREVG